MVSHCANPECRAPLHYLRSGRLYRFDVQSPTEPCRDVPDMVCAAKSKRTAVFFWLCEQCCSRFVLDFDVRKGVKLVAARAPLAHAAASSAKGIDVNQHATYSFGGR